MNLCTYMYVIIIWHILPQIDTFDYISSTI